MDNSKYRALHPLRKRRQRLHPDNRLCEDTAGEEKRKRRKREGKEEMNYVIRESLGPKQNTR
jgi:hypothetical protein